MTSLLNSRLLDAVARAALDVKHLKDPPRPYISKTLHIYMTLSNLRGVPYSVSFDGATVTKDDNCYHMITHGDRVHYAVTGLGTWDSESEFADNDQKREIEAASLEIPNNPDWKDYAVCALASAAFPVGLAPRLIGATLGKDPKLNEYDGRRWPTDSVARDLIQSPAWLDKVLDERPFWFTTADGGIIDNDPFEYARFSLKDRSKLGQPIEPALAEVDRAVIMVSPFPELKPIAPEGRPVPDLVSSFSALMPALIAQARFKPEEIVLAAKADHGSRYLIGPSRVTPDGKEQRYGIASGLLGGFGGFVARSFRDHDFQLGRRNCQRFLQDAFALPPKNPIFNGGIKDAGAPKPDFCPIIPLFGTAEAEVVLQEWPRISQIRFDTLQTRIAGRFDAVAPRLLAQNVAGPLYYLLLLAVRPFPWPFGLIRDKALKFVNASILADLVRRDMIEGWELPPHPGLDGDDIRLVLAELINPSYDLRNEQSLAKATGLTQCQVEKTLELLRGPEARDKPFKVWKTPWTGKDSGYALASRKPAWYRFFAKRRDV